MLVSVPELLRGAAIPGQPSKSVFISARALLLLYIVADDAIAALLKHRINQKDCITQGWVIAGFPTSIKQAEVFQKAEIVPSR